MQNADSSSSGAAAQRSSAAERESQPWTEWSVLALLTAAFLWLILSLPAFPTQDGPVHLYYAHVMRALATPGSVYSHFYFVKHVLPPYSLYYYALLGFMKLVPELTADRLVICCYVVLFVSGFAYLASHLGANGRLFALLTPLVVLNWPLGMGFVNFCASLALALWALGLWVRMEGRGALAQRVLFVLLTVFVMLTHPVPLLLVLLFCGGRLVFRFAAYRRDSPGAGWPAHTPADLVCLACATSLLLYVRRFTTPGNVFRAEVLPNVPVHHVHFIRSLGFFRGWDGQTLIYLAILAVALVLPLGLAVAEWRRDCRAAGGWRLPSGWLALAIALPLLLPFVPRDVNRSHFFADRLTLLIWLAAFLAAGACKGLPRWTRPAVIVFACVGAGFIVYLANLRLRPYADAVAQMERGPIRYRGQVGLGLPGVEDLGGPGGLSYDPYLWADAHFFLHNDAILYNTPWLDLQVIPLGPGPTMPTGHVPLMYLEDAGLYESLLTRSSAERARALGGVSFVVLDGHAAPGSPDPLPPVLARDRAAGTPWSCSSAGGIWFTVCQRDGARR